MTALGHLESRLSILRPLIEEAATIEVAINACGRVWVERSGDSYMSLSDVTLSPVAVKDLAGLIANKQRLTLTDNQPAISTTVEFAGAALRCQAIIPPASAGGTVISIRVLAWIRTSSSTETTVTLSSARIFNSSVCARMDTGPFAAYALMPPRQVNRLVPPPLTLA